jgi:hypothetical protein
VSSSMSDQLHELINTFHCEDARRALHTLVEEGTCDRVALSGALDRIQENKSVGASYGTLERKHHVRMLRQAAAKSPA